MNETEFADVSLTVKHREVLELLRRHMTSKEIARELGISPHTVDQRIANAKKRVNAVSRSDLIFKYQALLGVSPENERKPVYQEFDIAPEHNSLSNHHQTEGMHFQAGNPPKPSQSDEGLQLPRDIHVGPKVFDGQYGTLARIAAILGLAVFMLLLGVAGLAMFGQLSDVFQR